MNKFFLLFFLILSIAVFSSSIEELKSKLQTENDPTTQSKLLTDIGTEYYKNGDFANALEYFFKALTVSEKANNRKQIAVSYHGIGSVYMETEKYDDAVKYLKKAQKLFTDLKEQKSLGRVLNTLGNVHYMQLEDSLSETYYMQALEVCNSAKDSACLMDGYKNLGALYFEMGSRNDTLKALSFIKKSLHYVSPTDTLNLFQSNLSLAELYTYVGHLSEAENYFDVCTSLLHHIKALHILDDYYYCLHKYHIGKDDPEEALADYMQYKVYQDSILTIENAKQLAELNIKYETEQKEKQILLLKAQRETQRLTLLVVVMLVIILVIISTLLFVRYKRKQRIRKEQELQSQKEAERIRIARDMHDEIGAGLTRIVMRSGQVKLQLQSGIELKNGIAESLEKMETESRQLSHNIGEIIWSLNPKNDTLDALFSYLRNYAYDYLDEAGIGCIFSFPERIPNTSVSPELRRNVFLIVKESLNNLVKYAEANEAEFILNISENKISITIKDNGKGVCYETITYGNGLENMKKRAEENGGRFLFHSEIGIGTSVIIEDLRF